MGYMLRLYVCGIFIKSALVIPSRKFGDSVTTIKLPQCPTRGEAWWKLTSASNLWESRKVGRTSLF